MKRIMSLLIVLAGALARLAMAAAGGCALSITGNDRIQYNNTFLCSFPGHYGMMNGRFVIKG